MFVFIVEKFYRIYKYVRVGGFFYWILFYFENKVLVLFMIILVVFSIFCLILCL